MRTAILAAAAVLQLILAGGPAGAQDTTPRPEIVNIWPGVAPGTEDWSGSETDSPIQIPGMATLHMIGNVTTPTLTIYRPAPGKANGVAMLVLPGGGFQNLAISHEGELVAQWLADRGVTAFMLKYRVRAIPGWAVPADIRRHPERFAGFAAKMEGGREIAVQDGRQAMRYLRENAALYEIDPDRVGMIGFSAGAITTMGVILEGTPQERPDFAAPLYGAAVVDTLPPAHAPALFIAATQDDDAVPAAESVAIYNRWTSANLTAELHIYQRGGHGFGMMRHRLPVDAWTEAFEAWLKMGGWLDRPSAPVAAKTTE